MVNMAVGQDDMRSCLAGVRPSTAIVGLRRFGWWSKSHQIRPKAQTAVQVIAQVGSGVVGGVSRVGKPVSTSRFAGPAIGL